MWEKESQLHKFHFANFFTRCGEPHVCQAMFQSMATQARKRCIGLWWIYWMIHKTTSDTSHKWFISAVNKPWLVQWSRLPNITHSLPSWKHWSNTIVDYEVGGNPHPGFIKHLRCEYICRFHVIPQDKPYFWITFRSMRWLKPISFVGMGWYRFHSLKKFAVYILADIRHVTTSSVRWCLFDWLEKKLVLSNNLT